MKIKYPRGIKNDIKSVIDWHSKYADQYTDKYNTKYSFIERKNNLKNIINKYSNKEFTALDIGCGNGIFTYLLAKNNSHIIGIDASDKMISICNDFKKKENINNVDFYVFDINKINTFNHGKFHLIMCSSILEYVEDINTMIKMLTNLLKDNGILIITLPNKSSIYRKIEPVLYKLTGRPNYYRFVKSVLTLEQLELITIKHRLTKIECKYYGSIKILANLFRKTLIDKYIKNMFLVVFIKKENQ